MMELHQPRAAERYLPSNVLTGYFQVPVPLRPGKLLAQCRDAQMLIERHVPFSRHVVHAGDPVQSAGTRFSKLHLVHLGAVKTLASTGAGSLQVAGLHLKGDWIGFDGITSGECACDAIAMDTSEIWSLDYEQLLQAAAQAPSLLHVMHVAMSAQLAREREWRLALTTLPADARLADFLRSWAQRLAHRELRTDHVTLRLTRAEIGNYLGMTLETVSRSFSRLALLGLVAFDSKGRRHFAIPDVQALVAFVDAKADPDVRTVRQRTDDRAPGL